MNPSLWKIKDEIILHIPDEDIVHKFKAEVTIPLALQAYDTGNLKALFELRDPKSAKENGMSYILSLRENWQAPVSDWMMSAGKGVDTYKSTEDRDVEFRSGKIAQQGEETPYQWIYNGGLNPNFLRSPELFLKVPGRFITGPGGKIGRRSLAKIMKPEAEFGAVLAPNTLNLVGWIIGNDQTVNVGGNDGSNIVPGEAENTLLLPQAKVFSNCCGVGPCIILTKEYPDASTPLSIEIVRNNEVICSEVMEYRDYVRDTLSVIDGWLRPAWRELFEPEGGILMLGTGTKIPDEASVLPGDQIKIESPMFPAPFVQTVIEVK